MKIVRLDLLQLVVLADNWLSGTGQRLNELMAANSSQQSIRALDKGKWAWLQPLMSAITWMIATMQGVTNLMAAKRKKDDADLQEAKDSIKRLQKRLRMASAVVCRQAKAFEEQAAGEAVGYQQLLSINQALDFLVKASAELASHNADEARLLACQGLGILDPFVGCRTE